MTPTQMIIIFIYSIVVFMEFFFGFMERESYKTIAKYIAVTTIITAFFILLVKIKG